MTTLSIILLFALLYMTAMLGKSIGKRHIVKHPGHQLGILGVAEGAVFALFGLLVAFSFSGAYGRYEERKVQIIEEGNAINNVNVMLDLLPANEAKIIREDPQHYIEARIQTFQGIDVFDYLLIHQRTLKARELLLRVWRNSIKASSGNGAVLDVLVPTLLTVFDTANKQYALSRIHPPTIIFALLIGLATLTSFLIGYSTARKKFRDRSTIYIVGYIVAITFTLHIIMDLELPRLGLIKITPLDSLLIDMNRNLFK